MALATGTKIKAPPKPEKPRARPATKAMARSDASFRAERPVRSVGDKGCSLLLDLGMRKNEDFDPRYHPRIERELDNSRLCL